MHSDPSIHVIGFQRPASLLTLLLAAVATAWPPGTALARQQAEETPIALLTQQSALLRLAPDSPDPVYAFHVDAPGRVVVDVRSVAGDLAWSIVPPAASGLPTMTSANVASAYGGAFTLLPPRPAESEPAGLIVPMLPGTGGYVYLIVYDAPAAGTYTLQVLSVAPVGATPIAVDIHTPTSAVGVAMLLTDRTVAQGGEAVVSIAVVDGDDPFTGAAIAATVVRPDHTRTIVVAADDGLGSDVTAGDGLYTAVFPTQVDSTTFEPVGKYIVMADVTGTNALGNAFVRNVATTFEVTPRCPTLPTNVSANTFDAGIDENGDLCFESLEFSVANVMLYAPGTYRLSAGITVPIFHNRVFLATGDVTIGDQETFPIVHQLAARLTLSPDDLHELTTPQHFTVESLSVTMIHDGAFVDCETRTGINKESAMAYGNEKFVGWGNNWCCYAYVNPGPYPCLEVGEASCDSLYVNVGIKVHFTGNYNYVAHLYDPCGTLVATANNPDPLTLVANLYSAEYGFIPNDVLVEFSGAAIGKWGVSGPYRIEVALTGTSVLEPIEPFTLRQVLFASDYTGYTGGYRDDNHNGVPDQCDINGGLLADLNGNGVWDLAEGMGNNGCVADVNGDGVVNPDDLGDWIANYFGGEPMDRCADFNGDGVVNPDDIGDFVTWYYDWQAQLAAWCAGHEGACTPPHPCFPWPSCAD